MKLIFRIHEAIVRAMGFGAILMIAAMIVGITAEIMLRMFGAGSLPGLVEGTEYALYFSTFLSAPYLLRNNEHIRVDIVVTRLPPRVQILLEALTLIVVLVVAVVLFIYGTKILAGHLAEGNLVFKEIVFPQWWLDWIIPLSAVAFGVEAVERLLERRRRAFNNVPAA
jgi:TRAP-type C4-dicarboxylate transport system permease small subunit